MSTTIPTSENILLQHSALQQNQDIRGGKAAMYLNRLLYFRPLEGQNEVDENGENPYDTMVGMSPLYSLYPKVVDGFVGTIFQKPPIVENTDFDLSNVDLLDNNIDQFAEKITTQVLENGFCATITEWSDELDRAFMTHVEASQFVSFMVGNKKGYQELERFIYKRDIEKISETDEFDVKVYTQFIVLDFENLSNDKNEYSKIYRVRIFEETSEKALYQLNNQTNAVKLISTNYPMMNGKDMDKLPVIINGVKANNFSIQKSPLQDISDLNISLNQRTIDQVYMLHWTALPTPWMTGVDPEDPNIPTTIGPTKAWKLDNDLAKVGMLEFSGNAARAHQDFIDNLKETMASIGAQILKKDAVSRETATSVLIRTNSQTSLITAIVDNISSQIKASIKNLLKWEGQEYKDVNYILNDDFLVVDMDPNAQIALVKSWLEGAISHQSVFDKMKQGEIIPPKRTLDEEIEMIKENPPPFMLERLAATLKLEGQNEQEEKDTTGSNLSNERVYNAQGTENQK